MDGAVARHPVTLNTRFLAYSLIWLTFALSGIVKIEPAPFDAAIAAIAVLMFITGLRMPYSMMVPLGFLLIIFVFGLVGASYSQALTESTRHIGITMFLSIPTLFVGCLVYRDPDRALRVIFNGYAVAAMIAAIAGIIGYFSLTSGAYDLFTENARARGTFKDPNVFGPFLIPAALYAYYRLVERAHTATLYWLAVFGVTTIGVLLSFSRGAWGHYIISFAICVVLLYLTSTSGRMRMRISFSTAFVLVLGMLAIAGMLSLDAVSGLLGERLQLFQSYDVAGGHNRFSGQRLAIDLILQNPLGLGSGGFVKLWGQAPHNVYLHGFIISGWLGGFAYLALVLSTLACGLATALRRSPVQGLAIVAFASFTGLALLGLLIDTDHWRHFYLLLGIIWGISGVSLSWRASRQA